MEEKSKEQLEVEKLKLEIQNERKPLYKKLSFYSSLVPIVVSAFALIYSIVTGLFENESKLLDLRKENLQYEINIFTLQKDSLLKTLEKLKFEKDSLFNIIDSKKQELEAKKLVEKELSKKIASVSKNLIQTYIFEYANRIKATAFATIEQSEIADIEAKKWKDNFEVEVDKFIKDCINKSFGYGREYGIKLIPDTIRIYLDNESFKLLNKYKSQLYNDNDYMKLYESVIDYFDLQKRINTEAYLKELKELRQRINSSGDCDALWELYDAESQLEPELNEVKESVALLKKNFSTIRSNVINKFVKMLHDKLRYKDY